MFEDTELDQIRLKKIQDMLNQAVSQKQVSSSHPIILTDANFQSALKANDLLVVDFWAPWCGPCRMVGPIIEQLSAQYAGQVTFAKMNVDENQKVPSAFGIMSIPTIVVFHRSQPVNTLVGAYPKTHIENTFKPYLSQ